MEPILLIVDDISFLSNGVKWALSRSGHRIIYLSMKDNVVNMNGKTDELNDDNLVSIIRSNYIKVALFIPAILSSEVVNIIDMDSRLNHLIRVIFKEGVNKIIFLSSIWSKPDEPKGRHYYLWQMEEVIRRIIPNIEIFRISAVFGIEEDVIQSFVKDSMNRFLMVVPHSKETALLFIDDLADILSNNIQSNIQVKRVRYIIPPKRITIDDIARHSRITVMRGGILLVFNDFFYRLFARLFGYKKRNIYISVVRDFFREIYISYDGFDDDFSYNFKDIIEWIDGIAEGKVK
ncbi:MAG: hypothetical protein ACUVWP_03205 [bacterium]